jgi:MoxR-like ATPase
MAKSKSNPAEFQGAYVTEMRDALHASALSGLHLVMMSEPGWGKTAVARMVMHDIAGEENSIFIRCEGSTPPEAVKGMPDPAAALDSPPRIELNIEGTPYDPNAHIVLIDEIFRPNDVVFDVFVDTLNRQDVSLDEAPVVWGTSNFVTQSDRTAAVRDRFAMWVWIPPQVMDVETMVKAQLHRDYGEELKVPTNGRTPTLEDIREVKKMRPKNVETDEVISTWLEILAEEAKGQGFEINPRRMAQWTQLVYRTSAYYHEDEDFDVIHPQTVDAMRWAMPTLEIKEWRKWDKIVSSMRDVVGAAIDSLMREAYKKFKVISNSTKDKTELAFQLGEALAEAQRSLSELDSDDKRLEKAVEDLTGYYAAFLRGKDPLST